MFVKPDNKHCVVVEDAASACSVARLDGITGVALLSTNMSALQQQQILQYHTVTIVLDKDASRKAIKLASQLRSSATVSTISIRFTKEDLKYLSKDEVWDLLQA